MADTKLQKVGLDKDTTIQIEVAAHDPRMEVTDFPLQFEELTKVISVVAQRLEAAIAAAKPQQATVEFGIEAAVESGKLTALLVQGTAKANVKVSLTWKRA